MEATRRVIQVNITKGEAHYIAECLDLPVVAQGTTLYELNENLKEAITLHLEDEDGSEFEIVSTMQF